MGIGLIKSLSNTLKSTFPEGDKKLDTNKIKTKEVWSANKWYLFFGVLFAILTLLLEISTISNFITSDSKIEAGVLFLILQIPAMFCLLLTTMINDYTHRVKFNIYCCKLEDMDIAYIRENYYIEDIDEKYVLFVDKENDHNFSIWKFLHGYDSLYQTVAVMFP